MSKSCGNVKKVFVPTKDKKDTSTPKAVTGVGITEKAALKILHFLSEYNKSKAEYGLRIAVTKDGCSGKSYTMDLAHIEDSLSQGDKYFKYNDATVLIEKTSYMFIIGSTLDYVETLLMSGFQLNNPNIKKTCSCGSSFSV